MRPLEYDNDSLIAITIVQNRIGTIRKCSLVAASVATIATVATIASITTVTVIV